MLKLNRFFFDQAISIDNALTTNQIIHQIINQVKEVVEYVNSLETDAHEYTDAKVLELKTQLEHQISELETFLKGYADTKLVDAKNYTDSEIANLRLNYIDVKISEIYETITALDDRLNAKIDLVDATLTNLIDDVKAELIELIKKGNSIIYSGYSGELIPLQDEILNIYNILSNLGGLTWDTFNNYFKYYSFAYSKDMIDNVESISNGSALKINNIVFDFATNVYSASVEDINDRYDFEIVTNNAGTKECNTLLFNFRSGLSTYSIPVVNEVIDENYNRITLSIPKSFVNNSNYSYGQFARSEGGSYTAWGIGVRLAHNNPDVNYPQILTWSTIEMIQDLTSNGMTYNLVTFDFLTNFDNLLKVIDYDDNNKTRLLSTFTNNVYFGGVLGAVQNAYKIVASNKITGNALKLLINNSNFV